ncbi:MAG: hypothetical protein L6V95_03605 [Candidatus Melainabacteria bacterium]|nr:MAG: hypothetical protein L6V95_03605 [Candidatus Melainabacteria bacterium]
MKENIACEIPYLVDISDEIKQGKNEALFVSIVSLMDWVKYCHYVKFLIIK